MKILIADKVSEKVVKALEGDGAEVTLNPDLGAESLPEAVGDSEVLVVRSTRVTAQTIEAAPALALIIRAGAGVNTIDLEKASARGICVANCPGKNNNAVAELALGLMISADRRIPNATAALRAGEWKKKEFAKARGLRGRVAGIVGLGTIGTAMAELCRGLGMIVAAWSRSLTPERATELELEFCPDPGTLAERADAVSVHLALKPDTKKIIGKEFFDRMRPGTIFVNTSRGGVVDTAALEEAVAAKGLRAALDVYDPEPAAGEAPFESRELVSVLAAATPHIGASTDQAAEAIGDEVVRIVKAYRETGRPVNTVNFRSKHAAHSLVIRHFNHVGVLASVLTLLREDGVNIEEMENTIFDGETAAACSLSLDRAPSEKTIEAIRASEEIIRVSLEQPPAPGS
ncbi:MAG: NAD(P)-dependent oxidoreductase [Planctomycetota bacterium]